MSEPPMDFNTLNETEKRAVAERLLRIEQSGWKPFWCPVRDCDGMPHQMRDDDGDELWMDETDTEGPDGEPLGDVEEFEDGTRLRPIFDPRWAHNHARADQRLPPWQKAWVLAVLSGRGSGKTTTGTEFVTLSARKGLDGAIIGRRGTELVNTHVKTLLERAHPDFVPIHYASKDILVWPNGATTYLFSAERPENIRSVNLSYFWIDEFAFMDEIETVWMNARLATRIESPGNPIHILMTSTPTSTDFVMRIEDDPKIEVRRVSTYANRANLSGDYLEALRKEYEGTRMGQQELHGVVLRDVEGALWNDGMFRHLVLTKPSEFEDLVDSMDEIVVAVDPAGSKGPRSDATGIIAVGVQRLDENGEMLSTPVFYVLADGTLKGSPTEWAARTYKVARLVKASRIIAEKNFGGDMVKQVLSDHALMNPETTCDADGDEFRIKVGHASKSKEVRAEGAVGKYEQGRVVHTPNPTVFGDLSELEKEQVNWVPKSRGGRLPSPNRVDALVWAMRALESSVRFSTQSASGKSVLSKLKRRSAA